MELLIKGDEIGYISREDDQSFGLFCPVVQIYDDAIAAQLVDAWNSKASPASAPEGWKPLTDVQWMNIVNLNHAWRNVDKEDAINEVVKLVEAKCKANNLATPVLNRIKAEAYREAAEIAGPEDSYQDQWFKAKSDSCAKLRAKADELEQSK